jgi:hypothetical protein
VRLVPFPAVFAAILVGLGGGAASAVEPPFSFATAAGNLPKTVRPLDYTVELVPDPEHLTLSGRETVSLDVLAPTKTLVFNALNMRYTLATIDGQAAASIVPDDAVQRTTLTTRTTLRPGHHTLVLAFAGKMETTGQGLFVDSIRVDRCAPDVSVLGRAGVQGDLRADRHAAGDLECRRQHARRAA